MGKSDEQQRAIQKLDTRVKDVEKLNQDLVLVNKSQKDMIADLQEGLVTTTEEGKAKMTEMEFDKNNQIEELQSELDELKSKAKDNNGELEDVKAKLQRKEREFEVLTQEMFERSKSKFREIDVLRKQLTEAERNLSKLMERSSNATSFAEPTEDIESWKIPDWVKVEDFEQFKSLCDIHCQNEEEIREMNELRRKVHKKQQ